MRRIRYTDWKTKEVVEADFHQWAQDNDGDGNITPVALIEHDDGRMDSVYVGHVQFVDRQTSMDGLMVDMTPPATARDRWMYEQGRLAERDPRSRSSAQIEVERLTALINTPEIHDFAKGVTLEAVHQREKWGSDHDAGKTVWDWFWLIGYLAQKAADAFQRGDLDKAMHHSITTAAACCNWHAAMQGKTDMRPGIATPQFDQQTK